MPECPECGETIYRLCAYLESESRFHFVLDEKGEPEYIFVEGIDDSIGDVIEFACPECNSMLCTQEETAIALLQGGEFARVEESVPALPDVESYPVVQVSREEIAMAFAPEFREERMARMTDDDFAHIASKVGDLLIEYFWDTLMEVANE